MASLMIWWTHAIKLDGDPLNPAPVSVESHEETELLRYEDVPGIRIRVVRCPQKQLFVLNSPPAVACRQALQFCKTISHQGHSFDVATFLDVQTFHSCFVVVDRVVVGGSNVPVVVCATQKRGCDCL